MCPIIIKIMMAMIFTKIVTVLVVCGFSLLVNANQHWWRVNPVIIPRNVSSTCSLQEKQGFQTIKATVNTSLSNVYSLVVQCGDGPWYKVACLNMSDPSQACPPNWREYRTARGVRACGRFAMGCIGTFYLTGRQYSKVCGRIIGYQVASPDAFNTVTPAQNLNQVYADGVSITYGSPRTHMWTYSAGVTEGTHQVPQADCPCAVGASQRKVAPAFIGNNYYCESGNGITSQFDFAGHLYDGDPIWDGELCEGQCCRNGKSPPWFSVNLRNPTTDDIEVRICGDQTVCDEDTPIALMELYVQ